MDVVHSQTEPEGVVKHTGKTHRDYEYLLTQVDVLLKGIGQKQRPFYASGKFVTWEQPLNRKPTLDAIVLARQHMNANWYLQVRTRVEENFIERFYLHLSKHLP